MKKRTIVYIDGFNLYFGLLEKGWKNLLWLNLVNFSKSIIPPDNSFVQTKYFTSFIKGDEKKVKRQRIFLRANQTLKNISFYYGQYKIKYWECSKCKHSTKFHIEKKTDVNIATQMLIDAFQDRFDLAILVSGDSDLSPPISAIRTIFPNKSIIVAFPPERVTQELIQVSNSAYYIGKNKFSTNQLPPRLTTKDGKILKRPNIWK